MYSCDMNNVKQSVVSGGGGFFPFIFLPCRKIQFSRLVASALETDFTGNHHINDLNPEHFLLESYLALLVL